MRASNSINSRTRIAVNELQIFTPEPAACAECSEDFSGSIYGNGHQEMYRDISAFFAHRTPYPVDRADCQNTIQLLHAFYRANEIGQWLEVKQAGEFHRLGEANETLANLYRTPLLPGAVK